MHKCARSLQRRRWQQWPWIDEVVDLQFQQPGYVVEYGSLFVNVGDDVSVAVCSSVAHGSDGGRRHLLQADDGRRC